MSSRNHPTSDMEDAFSSNFLDYFPASPGNTSSESSNNSSVLSLSPMFDSRDFFPPKEIPPPKDTKTPVESPIPISPSSSVGSSSSVRMAPKRTSTFATSTMTQAAIRKLVVDSIAATLEEVANIAQRKPSLVYKMHPTSHRNLHCQVSDLQQGGSSDQKLQKQRTLGLLD
ncbi:hypothetical protein Tco_1054461 [Tanacetum coccineum]|uniref:Uncharacterized protein n=1 Tax=Tanacetum coccineum TaxID=301880 RepID=A0ABQ5GXQ9_9ASTR